MRRLSNPKLNTPAAYDKIFKVENTRDAMRMDVIAAKIRDDTKVVDLGCGNALVLPKIQARCPNCELHGLDWSKAVICKMLSKFPRINYRVGNFQDTPYKSGSFDYVLGCEIIEHVHDPYALRHEMLRIAKPGGTLILDTPWKESAWRQPDPYHVWEFDEADMRAMLCNYGHVEITIPDGQHMVIFCTLI